MKPVRAFKAVLWSFFGVRKSEHYASDLEHLTPFQVIAAGVIAAALFVLFLLLMVYWATHS
jgi:hypothetical protein